MVDFALDQAGQTARVAPAHRGPTPAERWAPFAAILLAAAVGVLVVNSHQISITVVSVIALVAVYLQSRVTGVVLLWCYWLFIPLVRRVFGLIEDLPEFDALALVPFLGTGVLAALEIERLTFSRRAKALMTTAVAGFAIGVPFGLATPNALAFAAGAYLSALAAFAIGYGERRRGSRDPALGTALAYALPVIAVYGIVQYFYPLAAWDLHWLESVSFGSIGSPEEGHIRIFATLNSPATLGAMLAIGILFLMFSDRLGPFRPLVLGLLVFALALTYVRSVWLSFVVALLIFVLSARGGHATRMVGVIAVIIVAGIVAAGANSTAGAFVDRMTSLGELSEDRSAQARLSTTSDIGPAVIREPFGEGIGQAGLATKLAGSEKGSQELDLDNGYLGLALQLGMLGFILVLAAVFWAVALSARAVQLTGGARLGALCLAILIFILVMHLSGDALYGVTGAVFWYIVGFVVAENDQADEAAIPASA
jgi:putative inorganic carbon (HCO3(-)) transporter